MVRIDYERLVEAMSLPRVPDTPHSSTDFLNRVTGQIVCRLFDDQQMPTDIKADFRADRLMIENSTTAWIPIPKYEGAPSGLDQFAEDFLIENGIVDYVLD